MLRRHRSARRPFRVADSGAAHLGAALSLLKDPYLFKRQVGTLIYM